MIATPDLIASLAANAPPVRRLRPPLWRAGLWLVMAAIVLTLLAVSHGLRPDLGERLQQPVFVFGVAASMLTGILAAIAAFLVSLPDRSRLWLLLPLPALAAWLSTIGYGCLTDWVTIEPNGIRLDEAAQCFATLVLTSAPLSLALLVMLRFAALFHPLQVAMTGSLAVAAIAATALSLFHELDASMMVLIWNFGTTLLIVGLARAFGRRLFNLVAPRPPIHP